MRACSESRTTQLQGVDRCKPGLPRWPQNLRVGGALPLRRPSLRLDQLLTSNLQRQSIPSILLSLPQPPFHMSVVPSHSLRPSIRGFEGGGRGWCSVLSGSSTLPAPALLEKVAMVEHRSAHGTRNHRHYSLARPRGKRATHTGALPSSKPRVTQHRSLHTVVICAKQRPRQAARVVSSLGHDVEAEVMAVGSR